jgi:integrase
MAQIAAVQKGRDPVTERRAARQARRDAAVALTVGMALERWQEARSTATDRPWSPRYVRAVASAVGVHVPATLRAMALREVTREAWTRTISMVTRTKPGAAAFLFTSISSFLAYAETMGWIDQHPLPRNGRSLIAPHVPARTRVLEDHEWVAVWKAAEREPVKLRAFTRLLILSACRVSEVADIGIHEITDDMAMWIIPAVRTKNQREHLVPICDLARHELRLVWPSDADAARDERRMLLGRFAGSGFSGRGKLIARLQVASGTADWTWHDLRRTARTTMTYLGVAEDAAEAALNHVSGRGKLVGIYDRSGPPPAALAALRAWQGYVADVLAGRRDPGDAEAQYRAALPEELRVRSRPTFTPRSKAKPGRARKVAAQVD